jgi:hypothetical protein
MDLIVRIPLPDADADLEAGADPDPDAGVDPDPDDSLIKRSARVKTAPTCVCTACAGCARA